MALEWHNGSNPVADSARAFEQRAHWRGVDLTPDAAEVADAIRRRVVELQRAGFSESGSAKNMAKIAESAPMGACASPLEESRLQNKRSATGEGLIILEILQYDLT